MFSLPVGPCGSRLLPPDKNFPFQTSLPQLAHYLEFQQMLMRRLGAIQRIIEAFERYSLDWDRRQAITILNLQCGQGEIAREIMRWGRRKRFDLRIVAADPDHRLVQIAKDHKGPHNEIYFETKDFSDASFLQAQQVDYVVNGLSLHRFDESTAVTFLKRVNLLAKRGFIVLDGVRDIRRWWAIKLTSPEDFAIKEEALKSVQQSFSQKEVHVLLTGARLDYAQAYYPWGLWTVIQSERALVPSAGPSPVADLAGA